MMSILGKHEIISQESNHHHINKIVNSRTVAVGGKPKAVGHRQQKENNQDKVAIDYKVMATDIAQKWNLTTPNAIDLLIQQFHKVNDYNKDNDFFHFHHLYKSGGTSISNLMDRTIGLPKSPHGALYYEHILPGSYMSGNFDHDEALKDKGGYKARRFTI